MLVFITKLTLDAPNRRHSQQLGKDNQIIGRLLGGIGLVNESSMCLPVPMHEHGSQFCLKSHDLFMLNPLFGRSDAFITVRSVITMG
jgi:hypothetical protein